MSTKDIIYTDGIQKYFGGITALTDVNIRIAEGEIHAIVGENGAGKSTLMKILSGVYQPDKGRINYEDRPVSFSTPNDAQSQGISIVFQELNLFPQLSVYRNIFINRELKKSFGRLDIKTMKAESDKYISMLGAKLDPAKKVLFLTTAEKQTVEIARALSQNSRVIILDEPNSALGEAETLKLFEILRDLRSRGMTIIYISHRLEEVFQIADRVSVMRDSRYISTKNVKDTSIPEIISLMIGKKLEKMFPKREIQIDFQKQYLNIHNLTKEGSYYDISFSLHKSEILGVYGLEGCGKEDLFNTIFGISQPDAGTIELNGKVHLNKNPSEAMQKGLALIPPDRRLQGLMIDWSILRNTVFNILGEVTNSYGIIDKRKAKKVSLKYIKELDIETDSANKVVDNLSGGNQQKVTIAKWMATQPEIFLMNDPTRGIDVGTKSEIYRLIVDLADNGMPVLFTSSEIDEVIGLSDRIIILYKGRLVYEGPKDEVDKETLLHYVNVGKASE